MKEQIFARPSTGDVDKGWAVLAVCWAFVACAFISTVLRVWVRVRLTRNMGPDDFNMIAAMVTTTGLSIGKSRLHVLCTTNYLIRQPLLSVSVSSPLK